MAPDRSAQRLYWAGVLFAVGSGVHILDHLRRGQGSVTEPLYWAGNLALIVQVAVITLVLTRHRLAPLAAAAGGIPLAIGFLAAHWLPEWSALSYLASTLEIIGALAVGLAGLAIVRRDGLASFGRAGASQATAA